MSNKNTKIIIKIKWSAVPNKLHLDALTRYPHRVQEDKRKKKPKHKEKYYLD